MLIILDLLRSYHSDIPYDIAIDHSDYMVCLGFVDIECWPTHSDIPYDGLHHVPNHVRLRAGIQVPFSYGNPAILMFHTYRPPQNHVQPLSRGIGKPFSIYFAGPRFPMEFDTSNISQVVQTACPILDLRGYRMRASAKALGRLKQSPQLGGDSSHHGRDVQKGKSLSLSLSGYLCPRTCVFLVGFVPSWTLGKPPP